MSEYISLQGIAVGILSGSEIMWWGTAARGVVQDAQCMVHTHTHDHQEPLSFLTPRFLFHSAVHENTIPVHLSLGLHVQTKHISIIISFYRQKVYPQRTFRLLQDSRGTQQRHEKVSDALNIRE